MLFSAFTLLLSVRTSDRRLPMASEISSIPPTSRPRHRRQEAVNEFAGEHSLPANLTVLADQVELPEEIDRRGDARERENWMKLLSDGNCEDPERVEAAAQLKRLESLDRLFAN